MLEKEDKLLDIHKDDISSEVVNHLKANGAFDEIRSDLEVRLEEDPDSKPIRDLFEEQCKHFCDQAKINDKLDLDRKKLREFLDKEIHVEKVINSKLSNQIDRILTERDEYLRQFYQLHARPYLEKFLLREESPKQCNSPVDMDIEDEEEDVERPAYSPIIDRAIEDSDRAAHSPIVKREREDIELPKQSFIIERANEDIERPTQSITVDRTREDTEIPTHSIAFDRTKEDTELPTHSPFIDSANEDIERPTYSPIIDRASEELNFLNLSDIHRQQSLKVKIEPDEQLDDTLTFSSVSPVSSAQLSEFNYLELSEDEANIVGKPKNTRVLLEEIEGQISDLQTNQDGETTNDETKSGQESSGIGKRTRRSNKKYSDYI